MIEIKRLHEVHKLYPNIPRRLGKTTYCYDSLLRASQTDFYRELAYITTTSSYARESFTDFIKFLDKEEENYQVLDFRTVVVNHSKITFLGKSEHKFFHFDGYIEDYFPKKIMHDTTFEHFVEISRNKICRFRL